MHGVNSECVWYRKAERFLCVGLNKRVGLGKKTDNKLKANEYIYEFDDGTSKERILKKTYSTYLKESKCSPMIRFYWGYRTDEGKIKLVFGS